MGRDVKRTILVLESAMTCPLPGLEDPPGHFSKSSALASCV